VVLLTATNRGIASASPAPTVSSPWQARGSPRGMTSPTVQSASESSSPRGAPPVLSPSPVRFLIDF